MRWKAGALAVLLFALAPLNEAASWGVAGHSIIAEIAQRRLHPSVSQRIKTLLDGEKSLASIASWPDQLALLHPETMNWHFVNIPYDAAGYDPDRDCRDTPAGDCVIKAIGRARTALANKSLPRKERVEALMLLIHLVGDVHQPLHVTDRNDAGGNRTPVTFFDRSMSLHAVWDVALIEKRGYDWGDYVRHLEADWLPGKDIKALARGEPVDWALEAHRIGVDVAYALPEDLKLGDAYYQRARPVIEQQLALAGIRLARMLNEAFGQPNYYKTERPAKSR